MGASVRPMRESAVTTNQDTQFGIHLPVRVISDGETAGEPARAKLLDEMAVAAGESGFRALWITDHLLYLDPWMDAVLFLASVAGRAEQYGLKLIPGVLALPLRHPVVMAQTLATLDILSGGNLVIGVGEGSTQKDFDAVGLPFEERRRRLNESVPLLRRLFTEEHVTHEGAHYSFEDISVLPHPLQQPHPPIWMSSWSSEIGLRRVARLGDGWVASGWHSTPEQYGASRQILDRELTARGKDPASFPGSVDTIYVYADESDSRAVEVAGPIIQHTTNTFENTTGHYIVGDYARCRELLGRWKAQGPAHVGLWPAANAVEQIRRFGEQVLPFV